MSDAISAVGIENFQVQLRTATHSWISDIPKEADGDGLGPNPFELLLSSLGSCTVITITHYAAQGGIALEKVTCDIDGEKDKESGDYMIKATVRVRGQFKDKDIKRIESYAKRCHVHELLEKAAKIDVTVEVV